MRHRNYNPVQPISPITITEKTQQERSSLEDDVINFIAEGGKIDVYNPNGIKLYSHIDV